MTLVLDGKKTREILGEELKKRIASLDCIPKLAILLIGEKPESMAYVNQKKKFGESINTQVEIFSFKDTVTELEIKEKIFELNNDHSYHGIILQLPIPAQLNPEKLIDCIDPSKDVDGLTSENVKKLWDGKETGHTPATAKGVITLLKYYGVDFLGKKVVIIGRSTLVGKPLALLFLRENATVTLCHSYTSKLEEETKRADIIVVATGIANLLTDKHVVVNQVVVDVGINLLKNNTQDINPSKKFVGDVDYEKVFPLVAAITPVPGGVGPMTVYSLFENLIEGIIKK